MTEEIKEKQIYEERRYWYYSEQKQTEIVVSISKDEEGENISIYDKYGRLEPALQDVPFLISMLQRLLHCEIAN